MRKPDTREWWETETVFIEDETKKPYSMGAFHNYCDMQARFAKKDGFPDLAARILAAKKKG